MAGTSTPVSGRLSRLKAGNVRLALRTWGEDDAPPVFFWHPLGAVVSGAFIGEVATSLASDAGVRVVALDAPGFGDSPALPPKQYDVRRLARLAWRAIDELGLERPVLVGHSWGALVALHAAAMRPGDVRALALLDAGHIDYADRPETVPTATFKQRVATAQQQLGSVADRAALREQVAPEIPREATDALIECLLPAFREQPDGTLLPVVDARTVAAARHGMVAEPSSSRWSMVGEAEVPTLLLLAGRPEESREVQIAAADRMREVIPQLDARVLLEWGHDLVADGGPDLAVLLGEWLRALPD